MSIGRLDANHSYISDSFVLQQECFELGRCDLVNLDLDQLLHAIDDEEKALVVYVRDVPLAEVPLGRQGVGRRSRIVPVPLHHVGSLDSQFACVLVSPTQNLRSVFYRH